MSSKSTFTTSGTLYRDPIAIDMDGDGVETLSQTDGAYFDLDKNGFAEKTGWIKAMIGLLKSQYSAGSNCSRIYLHH